MDFFHLCKYSILYLCNVVQHPNKHCSCSVRSSNILYCHSL